ncbi:hypothetical protein BJX68DRAFT_262368 [Aspergillus pseudodeflectus]|uniref:Uncharacterized protein n=1 Tax=Aspergillus pseudodeflectus TaxID=176178 RepID=A0ABR4L3S8_9EURO
MSLKRKASFPTIASPQPTQTGIDRRFMDDSPKHLHCRTRKRVRNDRPDEQTVYENTLRWLYTAQQRVQQTPTPPADQNEDIEPELPTAIDSRQQSLLQFFRPVQPSYPRCPSTPISQSASGPSRDIPNTLQGRDMMVGSPSTTRLSGTVSPASQTADYSVNMDILSGNGESAEHPGQWAGTPGWM